MRDIIIWLGIFFLSVALVPSFSVDRDSSEKDRDSFTNKIDISFSSNGNSTATHSNSTGMLLSRSTKLEILPLRIKRSIFKYSRKAFRRNRRRRPSTRVIRKSRIPKKDVAKSVKELPKSNIKGKTENLNRKQPKRKTSQKRLTRKSKKDLDHRPRRSPKKAGKKRNSRKNKGGPKRRKGRRTEGKMSKAKGTAKKVIQGAPLLSLAVYMDDIMYYGKWVVGAVVLGIGIYFLVQLMNVLGRIYTILRGFGTFLVTLRRRRQGVQPNELSNVVYNPRE